MSTSKQGTSTVNIWMGLPTMDKWPWPHTCGEGHLCVLLFSAASGSGSVEKQGKAAKPEVFRNIGSSESWKTCCQGQRCSVKDAGGPGASPTRRVTKKVMLSEAMLSQQGN